MRLLLLPLLLSSSLGLATSTEPHVQQKQLRQEYDEPFLSQHLRLRVQLPSSSSLEVVGNHRSLQQVQETVENIQIELRNIDSPLSPDETLQFEEVLSNWMDDFFLRGGGSGVTNYSSSASVTAQEVVTTGSSTLLLITYDQLSVYTPSPTGDTVAANDLVLLPFLNIFSNAGLGEALRSVVPSLANLPRRTISVPQVAVETTIDEGSSPTEAPVVLTLAPTSIAPTTGAPTPKAPTTGAPTTSAPVPAPTEVPTTGAPITETATTTAPISASPTQAPVATAVPTALPTDTVPSTAAPTVGTTADGEVVSMVVRNVVLEFPGGMEFPNSERSRFSTITSEWWEAYYGDDTAINSDLRNVRAFFRVRSQQPSEGGNLVLTDVELQYTDMQAAQSQEPLDPESIIVQPFLQDTAGSYLATLQAENLLTNARHPIGVSIRELPPQPRRERSGLVAGILVVLLLALAAVGVFTYYTVRSKEQRRVQPPPPIPTSSTMDSNEKAALAAAVAQSSFRNMGDMSTFGGGSDPYKDTQSDANRYDRAQYHNHYTTHSLVSDQLSFQLGNLQLRLRQSRSRQFATNKSIYINTWRHVQHGIVQSFFLPRIRRPARSRRPVCHLRPRWSPWFGRGQS